MKRTILICIAGLLGPSAFAQLGEIQGNSLEIASVGGSTIQNNVMHKLWLYRNTAGNNWYSASLHDGISVDASFSTPRLTTRAWWERNPNTGSQEWGDGTSTYFGIYANKIGVGTTDPENLDGWDRVLEVHGISHAKSVVSSSNVKTGIWSHEIGYFGAPAGGIAGTSTNHPFSIITAQSVKITVLPNGDVGIGTVVPKEKLSVNGNIRAKEIKVETANWPDYVFEKNYKLTSLTDLENYIKNNGHLPGIPTARTVEKEGIAISETIKAQQKIIEELTLHLIEKEKALNEILKRLEKIENHAKN